VTLYRLLLRVFPPAFRARFGDDMAAVFDDRRRRARAHGRMAVAYFWACTIVDLMAHGYAERRAARPLVHGGGYMRRFGDDLLTAARSLRRRAGFSGLAAAMLATGLGFNTALFSVVQAVLLKPLPYRQPDRIAMLWSGRHPDGAGVVTSYADFVDWTVRSRSFDGLATYNIAFGTITGDGDPEEVGGATVSPAFFDVLGARLQIGRGISSGDELIGVDGVRPIVIADSLWQRRFGRDPSILNRTVTLSDRPRRIVGVMSPDFVQPEPFWDQKTEFWSPMLVSDEMRTNHGFGYLRVIGRLAPSVTMSQAAAEMDAIGRRMMDEYPSSTRQSIVLARIADELIGDTRPMLWVFFGAVSLVLFLAIANVANLTLARTNSRRTEFAIRVALGASRGRLVSQLLAESTLVGLAGGIAGLIVAAAGIRLLLPYAQSSAPGIETASLGPAVIGFAIALSMLTGLACGAVPAWRLARARLASSLRDSRGTSGLEVSRMRTWLVAGEMALAVPLLVGATLLTVTLVSMQRVDPGFDTSGVLQFRITMSGARYQTDQARARFLSDVERRLAALPGAVAAGSVSSLPLGGLNNTGGAIVYEKADGTLDQLSVGYRAASAGYFAALNVPVAQGRTFRDGPDDRDTVIVNERAARAMWGDRVALGQRLRFGSLRDPAQRGPWLTVVGVVGDVRHEALTREPSPEIFQPYSGNEWSTMTVALKTSRDPSALVSTVRELMRDVDPRLALVNLGPAGRFVEGQLARPRFSVACAIVLGTLGLVLAASGAFAVLSLLVAQRTREIGIRMALGAAPRRVGSLMMRESLGPALAGCAAGGLAAAWLTRTLTKLLFGVEPLDARVFSGVLIALAATAALASWWPARRAMRVDPSTALRAD
jgi:putative ABC transport system permease protein